MLRTSTVVAESHRLAALFHSSCIIYPTPRSTSASFTSKQFVSQVEIANIAMRASAPFAMPGPYRHDAVYNHGGNEDEEVRP